MDAPPWLNAAFLAAALQGGPDLGPPVVVTKFTPSLAVAPGANYTSRMYRVHLEYTKGEEELATSLIVKAPLTKGCMVEMNGTFDLYGKEVNMYNEFLPLVYSMLNNKIGPASFYCSVPNALVLADLKEEGYEVCDRFEQLDFPHCEWVIKTLAQFHAASVACQRDRPDLIQIVGEEVHYKEGKQFIAIKPWIEVSIKRTSDILKELEVREDVSDVFISRIKTACDSCVKHVKPKDHGLNVLNHGDLWCNNIMFKHSGTGDVVGVKFVDFQVTRYSSPVLDIVYFIWTSANKDVRERSLPELFEIYRHTLNSTLEKIDCPERLSKEELQNYFKETVDWSIVIISNILPMIFCETENVVNLDDLHAEDFTNGQEIDSFTKICSGKQYRRHLPSIAKRFFKMSNEMKLLNKDQM